MPVTRSASARTTSRRAGPYIRKSFIYEDRASRQGTTEASHPNRRAPTRKSHGHSRTGSGSAGAKALTPGDVLATVCSCGSCLSCEIRLQMEGAQEWTQQMGIEKESTREQRLVQTMVFREITAYPDEAWSSLLGALINRFVHAF
jgi:hypothetical protein